MSRLDHKFALIILVGVILIGATGSGVVLSEYEGISTVHSGSDSNVINSGTYINISAARGWVMGQFYNFSLTSNSTLTGAWHSTKLTSIAMWYDFPNKSRFPAINGTTMATSGVVDFALTPGHYAIVFQTPSLSDSITITQNFTLKS